MDLIKLKSGLEFVILDKISYKEEQYLYLSSYDKDMNIIFAKLEDNKIIPIDDGNIIVELMDIVTKKNIQIKGGE